MSIGSNEVSASTGLFMAQRDSFGRGSVRVRHDDITGGDPLRAPARQHECCRVRLLDYRRTGNIRIGAKCVAVVDESGYCIGTSRQQYLALTFRARAAACSCALLQIDAATGTMHG